MKTVFLSLLLLMALGGPSQAQDTRWGFKLGPSLTNFTGDVRQADYLLGVHAGVIASMWVSENFSIQPELLYSQKGTKTVNYFYGPLKADVRLHYVDVPLLAHYRAGSAFLELGPQFGVLASARLRLERSSDNDHDVTAGYQALDVGFAVGCGLQAQNGFLAGARYNRGVLSIVGGINTGIRPGDAPRNGAFQFYVGYLLPRRRPSPTSQQDGF